MCGVQDVCVECKMCVCECKMCVSARCVEYKMCGVQDVCV